MTDEYKKIDKNTNIFLIHGIGSSKLTFLPLKIYLNKYGFNNVYPLSYDVNNKEFSKSLDTINEQILEILDNQDDEIVVIGQSYGGIICNNLHRIGRNILKSICICSPLHGAKIVGLIENNIPTFVSNILKNKALEFLRDKDLEEKPPHDFHTISFGWFNTEFDGCVYKHETILDPEKHTHISWCDHRIGFLDIRLFNEVYNILNSDVLVVNKKEEKIEEKGKDEKYSDL